jgi:hypothetical protein
MRNRPSRTKEKPVPKAERFKTTLYLPAELWKAVKIAAIESDRDATELVVEALQQYMKNGGRS